jgi:hypothetical protein
LLTGPHARSRLDKDAVGVSLGAVGFIPLVGDAAKLPKQLDNIADALKLANKIASSPFSTKLDRISEHLQMKDLTAAARELKGEVVERKANGVPWDHVHEVVNAQEGLINTIGGINKRLAHPNTRGCPAEVRKKLPEGVTRAEWSKDLLKAGHDRLNEAARQR